MEISDSDPAIDDGTEFESKVERGEDDENIHRESKLGEVEGKAAFDPFALRPTQLIDAIDETGIWMAAEVLMVSTACSFY